MLQLFEQTMPLPAETSLPERPLGGLEHTFWLYDQEQPIHFSLCARVLGKLTLAQLEQSLRQVQQQHPLLRVKIALEPTGQPKFVEQEPGITIPVRVVASPDDQQWQQELATELSTSFDWQTAPLVRLVWVQSTTDPAASTFIVTCHHAIADGMSSAYLLRNIVDGLDLGIERDTTVKQPLTSVVTVEQLFPQQNFHQLTASETSVVGTPPASPPSSPIYNTSISSRPRPHLRTARLSVAQTETLLNSCRQHETTVHAIISAAFLLALTQQPEVAPRQLRCLSPINVRPYFASETPEAIGVYVSFGLSQHELRFDTNLWEIARSLKTQLQQSAQPQHIQASLSHNQVIMAGLPDGATVFAGMRHQYGADLVVTNLGRLRFTPTARTVQIQEIYGPALMHGSRDARVLGVATFAGQLTLTFACSSLAMTIAETNSLFEQAMQILSAATTHHSRQLQSMT